ncbi:hypothetical protein LB506_000426 [Fusarium annulatum]|nr:hypothetical protein LB506_000426 [Fusarium annulatum]
MASQIHQVNNLDLSAGEHDCQQGWSMWICTKTNPAPKSETIAKSHHRCHQQRTVREPLFSCGLPEPETSELQVNIFFVRQRLHLDR